MNRWEYPWEYSNWEKAFTAIHADEAEEIDMGLNEFCELIGCSDVTLGK